VNYTTGAGTGVALGFAPTQNYSVRYCSIEAVNQDGNNNMFMAFKTVDASDNAHGLERMRITSDGKIGINLASPDQLLHVSDTSNGAAVNPFRITNTGGSAGTEVRMEFECGLDEIATISAKNEGSDQGPLIFSTASSQNAYPSEKMRLNSDGDLLVARTTSVHGGVFCVDYTNGASAGMAVKDTLSSGTGVILHCVNGSGTVVGSISQDQSNVTYGGTSDYRLKENVVSISDGITRLKTLKPSRFNWIADSSNTTIDGFLAHEASTAVPESVVGEKDAVATEDSGIATKGDPIYQQMDNAKLVPLLTAALQEAIAKIETLEAEVAALKSS
jgi:hypothetical protein